MISQQLSKNVLKKDADNGCPHLPFVYSDSDHPYPSKLVFGKLVEDDAVRLVDLDLFAVHDKKPLLEIHFEEGHCIGLVIK